MLPQTDAVYKIIIYGRSASANYHRQLIMTVGKEGKTKERLLAVRPREADVAVDIPKRAISGT